MKTVEGKIQVEALVLIAWAFKDTSLMIKKQILNGKFLLMTYVSNSFIVQITKIYPFIRSGQDISVKVSFKW